ncbi:putative membrane protein [Litoreibacter ponti]|uniref:Putative membrane protein n=1 Tax=Litoreibacter ponti TaxID=1510457 RepID=A0A2T6BJ26_9RHOB|nr:DUF2254 domain-containing protein [Litoreibacter ponti]PTX56046.1 putative membrane protein [Litoreibacter ponti]
MSDLLKRFAAWPITLFRLAKQLWRELWVRVAVMGAFALFALMLAQILGSVLPDEVSGYVSAKAADRLLSIIANAMLAVTTFSLTVMVTVYRSSSSQFTPRLHRLIMQDPTTQNTLATFIGAYVYALVGIVLRELDIFADEKAFVLFATTVLVLALVVYSMIRWVLHLQLFGSLTDTTRQVEDIVRREFDVRLSTPCLGAHPFDADKVPSDAVAVTSDTTGYVQEVFHESLQERAEEMDCKIHLCAEVGHFVVCGEPLAYVQGSGPDDEDEDLDDVIRAHIHRGDMRTYDQDPRFGLMVMGEIASKALSPGINDPGTAIDVITRLTRILAEYRDETEASDALPHDRLWIKPLDPDDLFEDAFGALARDGVALVEVQQRLQSSLSRLMNHESEKLAAAAKRAAGQTYARAMAKLDFEADREKLRASTHPDIVKEADADLSR